MAAPGVPRQLELFHDDLSSVVISIDEVSSTTSPPAAAPEEKTNSNSAADLPSLEQHLQEKAVGLAAGLGLRKLSRKVTVHWNARMRTTAGRAHYDALRIELNPGLLRLPGIDGKAEVDRTLRHELAHLVAYSRTCGRRIDPHGPEWRKACRDLGIPGESRCHTLPFPTRKITRKYLYQCPACGVEIRRVRKFRKIVACYSCCREKSGGRYDDRFRLKGIRQKSR